MFAEAFFDNYSRYDSFHEFKLDWENNDKFQQAAFFDYLKGKRIRVIVMIMITETIDSFFQIILDSLGNTDLKDHVILFRNNDEDFPVLSTYQGYTLVNMMHAADIEVLYQIIESITTAVRVPNLVLPINLFKSPIKTTREEIVSVYIAEHREFLVNETRITSREDVRYEQVQLPHSNPIKQMLGLKETISVQVNTTLNDTEFVMVNRSHHIQHVYKLKYAELFDGMEDLYEKEFLGERLVTV
jgi:hypothetical protein